MAACRATASGPCPFASRHPRSAPAVHPVQSFEAPVTQAPIMGRGLPPGTHPVSREHLRIYAAEMLRLYFTFLYPQTSCRRSVHRGSFSRLCVGRLPPARLSGLERLRWILRISFRSHSPFLPPFAISAWVKSRRATAPPSASGAFPAKLRSNSASNDLG